MENFQRLSYRIHAIAVMTAVVPLSGAWALEVVTNPMLLKPLDIAAQPRTIQVQINGLTLGCTVPPGQFSATCPTIALAAPSGVGGGASGSGSVSSGGWVVASNNTGGMSTGSGAWYDNTTATPETSVCTASAEVCGAYAGALGRLPDRAGAIWWEDRAAELRAQGYSGDQVTSLLSQRMAGSALGQSELGHTTNTSGIAAEQAIYSASVAAGGVSNATAGCSGGTDCSGSMSQAITQNTLADIYAQALGREPDPAGAAFWASQISSGAMTPAQVEQAIWSSSEAQLRW